MNYEKYSCRCVYARWIRPHDVKKNTLHHIREKRQRKYRNEDGQKTKAKIQVKCAANNNSFGEKKKR